MKLLLILVLCFSAQAADLSRLFHAIAKVESSGNPKAVNRKENALGLYQIRPAYFRDAKIGGKHSDVLDPKKAQEVVMAYFRKYEPEAVQKGNLEALARLHNAGPNWRKKKSATNEYWNKVKKSLWRTRKIWYSFNSWKEINMTYIETHKLIQNLPFSDLKDIQVYQPYAGVALASNIFSISLNRELNERELAIISSKYQKEFYKIGEDTFWGEEISYE